MHTLGGQAAIVIENAHLIADLHNSNLEITLAYDTTLEGWAKALEFRDQETEGHSQRVTDLSIIMAASLGLDSEKIIHIRRGAILHDIGKMGIPDNILHKPGNLNDKEWDIMRQYPKIAHDLLNPIEFLKKPSTFHTCHHERWDGSIYPKGLQGVEIPLFARTF
ncbi:MAG: HD domain-containing protein [Anaerolineaceae bacterium]|nr:HD domain-containing protein [Anaerolineaceae bacterium]